MKKIFYFTTISLAMLFFLGCSSKTTYVQYSGKYLNSSDLLSDSDAKYVRNKNINYFREAHMEKFYNFADDVYSQIEKKIAETEKFSMGNKMIRDQILYKDANKEEE